MRNTFKLFATLVTALALATPLASCGDDDDEPLPCVMPGEAIVTLKTTPETGQFYMQLNDSVTLIPTNISQSPYGNKEMRAYIVYHNDNDTFNGHYSFSAFVNAIDTIRTKDMSVIPVDSLHPEGVLVSDPLEIYDDWMTVCEDGYLTIHFRTRFNGKTQHTLRLVRLEDGTLELLHDANGDLNGTQGDGLIAFRLNDMPDTHGECKEFKLEWMSFTGIKNTTFKYKTRF